MTDYISLQRELENNSIQLVQETTRQLQKLLDIVNSTVEITCGKDGVHTTNRLSTDDLQALAIRIPAECTYIQAKINSMAIGSSLQSLITEDTVTQNLQLLQGTKGDAKERLRRAESMSLPDLLRETSRQQTIKALQEYINRADKVYEGIKKVIDARNREYNFDRKPGHPL